MKVHSAAIRLTTSSGVNIDANRHHLAWTLFGVLGLLLTRSAAGDNQG
jgi:hypothetical protein